MKYELYIEGRRVNKKIVPNNPIELWYCNGRLQDCLGNEYKKTKKIHRGLYIVERKGE